jgi:hypothetical protein
MQAMRQKHLCNTEGEASMSKEDAIKLIKLLSAMESWAFSTKTMLPDYLHEDLCIAVEKLERVVLEQPQEKYTYGTPLMDAMTKEKQ